MAAPAVASTAAVDTKERPEKENGSSFQQQKLPHFYAQHNPPSTIICMFIVAIAFIPVGASILVASEAMFEKDVRYDQVNSYKYDSCSGGARHQLLSFDTSDGGVVYAGCRVRKTFTLSSKVKGPIYMYYRLVGFYQNYRQYAQSLNEDQMQGVEVTDRDSLENCEPFTGPSENNEGTSGTLISPRAGVSKKWGEMQYSPCGAVPWSMFNDTIALYRLDDDSVVSKVDALAPATELSTLIGGGATLICDGGGFAANGTYVGGLAGNACTKKGIALEADSNTRFKAAAKNDVVWHGEGQSTSDNHFQKNGWYANEIGHKIPVNIDEDFMVWTRIAGLADFRKLYRKLDDDLEAGTYVLDIVESYDVASFDGEKHVVLMTTTWIGGRNYVLGSLFIAFGGVCLVLAVGFLVWYVVNGPRRRGTSPASSTNNAATAAATRPL
jgi:hypothetical protein